MRVSGIVVVMIAALAVTASDVGAACIAARAVSSKNPTGISHVYTPGGPFGPYDSATNRVRGSFWSLGYGNPVDTGPPNNDSGSNSGGTTYSMGAGGASNWLEIGYYGGGTYIGDLYGHSHWQWAGTDGCIDWDGSDGDHVSGGLPDGDECLAVLLDDDDDHGTGYFLVASQSSTNGDYFVNQALGNGDVDLVPIPVPQILSAVSAGLWATDVTFVVPCPAAPADGLYANCTPGQNEWLREAIDYRLYYVFTAIGAAPWGTASRDLPSVAALTDGGNPTGWALVAASARHCGVPVQVHVNFPQIFDVSAWFCAALVVDGFETTHCSANSSQIYGWTLAHPDDPVVPREKPQSDRRRIERDRRQGDRDR